MKMKVKIFCAEANNSSPDVVIATKFQPGLKFVM